MTMSLFVESIKRLYQSGELERTKIEEFHSNGKISDEEYNYILEAH